MDFSKLHDATVAVKLQLHGQDARILKGQIALVTDQLLGDVLRIRIPAETPLFHGPLDFLVERTAWSTQSSADAEYGCDYQFALQAAN